MASTICGYCKHRSHMTRTTPPTLRSWESMGKTVWLTQAAFVCDNCENLSVAAFTTDYQPSPADQQEFPPQHQVRWQPQAAIGQEFEDVPLHIASAASEAHSCQSIGAHRAAVLLARAVIEATAKDKGITSGNLVAKIDALANKGHIRDGVAEAAHEVRYLGNDMAHGDLAVDVSIEDSEDALAVMADVLREVFQSHERMAQMKARREAKNAAEH